MHEFVREPRMVRLGDGDDSDDDDYDVYLYWPSGSGGDSVHSEESMSLSPDSQTSLLVRSLLSLAYGLFLLLVIRDTCGRQTKFALTCLIRHRTPTRCRRCSMDVVSTTRAKMEFYPLQTPLFLKCVNNLFSNMSAN